MRRYLKSQHVNKFLRDTDPDLHEEIREMCVEIAMGTLGEGVEESIGDCLVFVWFCSVLIEHYSTSTQLENLRVSFISKAISEINLSGDEVYESLLPGMGDCGEWEDYCSLYGSLEELYDNIDEDATNTHSSSGERLATLYMGHVNLDKEFDDIRMANFDFVDNPNAPIMLFS